jgi:hypothetical protein
MMCDAKQHILYCLCNRICFRETEYVFADVSITIFSAKNCVR